MTKIDKQSIKHVARLAKLELSEKEIKTYSGQLSDVLEYMTQLDEVKTDSVEPTYQILDGLENVLREDRVTPSFSQSEALSQARSTSNGYFLADHVFSETRKTETRKDISRKKLDKNNAVLTQVDKTGTVGHKDLFMTKGVETTAGSHVLDGYKAHYSSTVVELLEKAGHKTKYKLNLDAWGHGSSGENSDYGETSNPWNKKCVAGGSSSGSAAAVSAGLVEVSTGTDTCGSVRMPASYCNICGLKPTYGSLSRYGVIAFSSSLDCPGLMTKSVKSLNKYYKEVSRIDPKDATSQSKKRGIKFTKVKRIGIPVEFFEGRMSSEVKKSLLSAIDELKKSGYEIVDVSLPHAKFGIAVYYLIAPTETSSNLARFDGVRVGNDRRYFGPEAKRRIMLGTFASTAGYADKYYEKAARVRSLIIKDFQEAFEKVDVILAPTSPIPPFTIGEKSADPLQLYLMDVYMAPGSLAGIPGLALPCGFSKNNLPIGMQLLGPRWSEERLFEVGEKYQEITDWHTRKPGDSK